MSGTSIGWDQVVFGEVVVNSTSVSENPEAEGFERYIIGKHIPEHSYRIETWGPVGDSDFGPRIRTIFQPGDVICTTRGPKLKVARADFHGLCAHTNFVLRTADPSVLIQPYLEAVVRSDGFQQHLVNNFRGSVNLFVNWSDAAEYKFFLPPVEEQQQIAEALQSAENVSDTLLNLLVSTRIAQSATFNSMLKSRNAKPTQLGDILVRSPRNGCSASPATAETGHWVLALSAISPWGYRAGQLKAVDSSPDMTGAIIEQGDLVVSRSNTRELVGLPAVFPEARQDVSYPDTMMRLSFDPSAVDTRYIELCLRTAECRREVQSYAAGTSASMKKINGTNLRKVRVPMVSYEDQQEVLSIVGHMTQLLRETDTRLSNVRDLTARIRETMVSGRGEYI